MADFLFVSRYSIANADLTVVDGSGAVVDADSDLVTAYLYNYSDPTTLVLSRACSRVETGVYRITLSSAETATPGLYLMRYLYELGSVSQEFVIDIEIPVTASPLYEAISSDMQYLIENVWNRFADLFDSQIGGPHLQMYAQSNFGRERIAQLTRVAIGRINSMAQPFQSFSIEASGEFPIAEWGALLEQATVVEVIKHLMRSYVEQPDAVAIPGARMDRRDYLNRWSQMLQIEEATLQAELDVFKIASLSMSRPSILVAGGVYGNFTRIAPVGRPRYRPPWNW